MIILSADFIKSSTNVADCPKTNYPEYAFIGRSNVGKSSLINMICNKKALAKTSSTPGKTQLLNHFLINNQWYIADLPGFGFAKVSKKARLQWNNMSKEFLRKRKNLLLVFFLVDARLEPQEIDIQFMKWLGVNQIPFCIVFTKTDKINLLSLKKNIAVYKNILLRDWEELPEMIISAATTKTGREELLSKIEKTLIFGYNT